MLCLSLLHRLFLVPGAFALAIALNFTASRAGIAPADIGTPRTDAVGITQPRILLSALDALDSLLGDAKMLVLDDLQTFSSALGGIKAPAIKMSGDKGRPFMVMQDTFPDFQTAGSRSCDVQYTMCSDAANGNGDSGSGSNNNDNKNGNPNSGNNNNNKNGNSNTSKDNNGDSSPKGRNGPKATGSKQNSNPKPSNTSNSNTSNSNTNNNPKSNDNPKSNSDNNNSSPKNGGNGSGNSNNPKSSGPKKRATFSAQDCTMQKTQCTTTQKNAAIQSFQLVNIGPDPQDPGFDLLCSP